MLQFERAVLTRSEYEGARTEGLLRLRNARFRMDCASSDAEWEEALRDHHCAVMAFRKLGIGHSSPDDK
jgi:hypothetical protein